MGRRSAQVGLENSGLFAKTLVFFRKVHRFFLVVEAVLFQRKKNREKAEQGSLKTVERL